MTLRRLSVQGTEEGGDVEDSQNSGRGVRTSIKEMSPVRSKRSSFASMDSKELVTMLPAKSWKQNEKSFDGGLADDRAGSDAASSVSSLDDEYMEELRELELGMQEALKNRKKYYKHTRDDSHVAHAVEKYLSIQKGRASLGQQQDDEGPIGALGEEEISGRSPVSVTVSASATLAASPPVGTDPSLSQAAAAAAATPTAATSPNGGARTMGMAASMMEATTTNGGPLRDDQGYARHSVTGLDASNPHLSHSDRVENMWHEAKYSRNNGKLSQKLPKMAEERKQAMAKAIPAKNSAKSKRDPVEKLKQQEVDKYYNNMKERLKKLDANEHDVETEQFPDTSDLTTAVLGGIRRYHQRCGELGRFYTFQADEVHQSENAIPEDIDPDEMKAREMEHEAREDRRRRRLEALPGLLRTLQQEA